MAEPAQSARYFQLGALVTPSSSAVDAVFTGKPGGWGAVVVSTLARSMIIAPGFALAGARGRTLWLGSVLGATGITLMLFGFYASSQRRSP